MKEIIIGMIIGWLCLNSLYSMFDFIFYKRKLDRYVMLETYIVALLHIITITVIFSIKPNGNKFVISVGIFIIFIAVSIAGTILAKYIKNWHIKKENRRIRKKYGDNVIDNVMDEYVDLKNKIIEKYADKVMKDDNRI